MRSLDYVLIGISSEGETVFEHHMTAEEVVVILAAALNKVAVDKEKATPTALVVQEAVPEKKGRKARKARRVRVAASNRRQKGARVCSVCEQPGHNARGCPEKKGKKSSLEALDAGYREPRRDAISRMNFSRVKMANDHDIPPETIARNLDVSVDEVRKVLEADTYSEYAAA